MFFDHYPYTNFHNINLDWVLQAVKAWGQTVEANDRAFRDLKEANEDFKRYVTNYLQDLDITDEINTKLDAMLASGVLTPYFAPYVKGYVDSWLASHVTPTSPALDSTLTLSGAAARADSTGKRLKDLAYVDALSTPEVIASLNRSQVLPGYRVQGIAYDYNGHYYVCGGSVDETGTGVIVKMTKPDFTDAEITEIPQLGHANDITYYNGYLYVCAVGGGDAPRWGIYKINVNDFTDKTLISNAPENTIGISYRQGDFWLLAPYRIYRTTDFTSYEIVVGNTNDLLTAYGIPTEGRISQTLFRAAGYLIGWVCSFVYEDRHYGALTFFNSTGEPIAFKMFPAYHSEIQGAVYAHMSIYLLADGNMVNVFRMDPRHLSYVQLKAGDDLNSFTGRGTLYSTGSNVSAELLNSPSAGEGFTVQVDRLGVYNTIQTARTNSGRELYRIKSFNNDTWGEWIEPAAEIAEATGKILIPVENHSKNYDFTVFASEYVKGKYYQTNGTISTSASYNYYSKIPVVKGNTYHFVGGRGARYVVLYNNNVIVQTAEITTVFTAQYDGELYVTEFSATPLKMYLYNDFYKITEWTNDNVNGYRYSTSDNSHIYISSTAGDIMHLKLKSYDGSHFSSFLLYAVVNGVNTIVATLYSVPDEVVFIAPNASDYLWYINRSQSETANFEFELTNYTKKTIFNSLDKLEVSDRFKGDIYGKKIACLGDSFTYGVATYVAKMNNRYLSKAINYGVASSRIVLDATSGGNTIQSFLNRYSAMDNDAEIVTIFGGINDSYDIGSGALNIGDINSELDTTTFYGGLKLLVTNLMKKYPDKQIIGIIPPDCQTGAYYIANLPAVQNAEREVYNMYGIPIIDLKRECYKMSTLAEMVALYRGSSTDIHPSNAGQEALCDTISAGIRRIIP